MKHYDFEGLYSNFTSYTLFQRIRKHPAPRSFIIFCGRPFFCGCQFLIFCGRPFLKICALCYDWSEGAQHCGQRGSSRQILYNLYLVDCTSCTLRIVPWTLHGCCGQGGSSHQIGPQLNTNLPRFIIFVDTNRTGNDKDNDRGCAKYVS